MEALQRLKAESAGAAPKVRRAHMWALGDPGKPFYENSMRILRESYENFSEKSSQESLQILIEIPQPLQACLGALRFLEGQPHVGVAPHQYSCVGSSQLTFLTV